MSSSTHRVWREYTNLDERERREFIAMLRDEWEQHPELSELFPQQPPGAFANIDSPEEIAELNRLAKHSVIEISGVE